MKKYFGIKNIIILVLSASTTIVAINPMGVMPNRTEYHEIIDSIPYAVHDTIPFESLVEVEVPVDVPIPYAVHDTVLTPVDTNAILKDYLVRVEVKETLTLPNKQGTIDLTEVVSGNKIIDRTFVADVKQIVKKDTIYTPQPKKGQFFAGFDMRFDKPNVVELLGVGLVYKDKSDKLYKVDIGVSNRVDQNNTGAFTPYFGGGVYWKVKVKR